MKRREEVLRRLRDGEITVLQAAEIAETTVWDVAEIVEEENVTWVSDDHLESDLRDL